MVSIIQVNCFRMILTKILAIIRKSHEKCVQYCGYNEPKFKPCFAKTEISLKRNEVKVRAFQSLEPTALRLMASSCRVFGRLPLTARTWMT